MVKKKETNKIWTIGIIVVMAILIISPLDLLPLIELDDGVYGIVIGKLLDKL